MLHSLYAGIYGQYNFNLPLLNAIAKIILLHSAAVIAVSVLLCCVKQVLFLAASVRVSVSLCVCLCVSVCPRKK